MPNNPPPAAPPIYLIYVRSVAGVCPQVWRDPPNPFSDYWNNKRSGFERIVGSPVQITEYAAGLPLENLRVMHPPIAAE